MNEYGLLKLKVNNDVSLMHYTTEYDLYIYILTKEDSLIVDAIEYNPIVEVSFDLKKVFFIEKPCEIITDQEEISQIFNKMLSENNTYFKQNNGDLILLKMII